MSITEIPDDDKWLTLQYEMFGNSIMHLHDSFYKLASMSFVWNASLGAGVAFTINDDYFFIKYFLIGIGIVYNIGAGVYYKAIVTWIKHLEISYNNMINNTDALQYTKDIILNFNDQKRGFLHKLFLDVGMFYFGLAFVWFIISLLVFFCIS